MTLLSNATSKVVAKINNAEILIIEEDEKRVPIKPICNALEVDFKKQQEIILNNETLSSVYAVRKGINERGEKHITYSLPLKYIFGWIYLINKNKECTNFNHYKDQCYSSLWEYLTAYQNFLEIRQYKIEEQVVFLQKATNDFNDAKNQLLKSKDDLNKWIDYSYEQYLAQQLKKYNSFD